LRAGAPKGKVFFHVPTALKHRTGNDPMNVHLAVANIAQYALIGCGLTAHVVMLGKAVDGDRHAKARDIHPLLRNRNDATSHQQRMNAQFPKHRQDPAQFPMADHRFSTDQGYMNRAMHTHETEDALYQGISAKIAKLPQRRATAKMVLAIGIAPWAT